MTIQLPNNCWVPQIDASQSHLFSDSHGQPNSDPSFEDKLKFEKNRLNLFFSPFAQLQSFFASQPALGGLGSPLEFNFKSQVESQSLNYSSSIDQVDSKIFDSASPPTNIGFPNPNRQIIQALMKNTDWLVPNLEGLPFFSQAFLQGKLQPSFDLQNLIDQILEQVSLVKGKSKTELSLSLKPENMGEIILTLVSHAGRISIEIQASPETKKLIDSRRQELEWALKKAKVNIDTIQISEVKKNAV